VSSLAFLRSNFFATHVLAEHTMGTSVAEVFFSWYTSSRVDSAS